MTYDIIIIGSGPGGYVAAIRASQLGSKVAVVERSELGGICLNWGCIPTKALLKSAEVLQYAMHSSEYGVNTKDVEADLGKMVERSRNSAESMSKGIQFLFKKNKIDMIEGTGSLISNNTIEVTDGNGEKKTYEAKNIILATGGRSKELPNIVQDGKKVIGYREAMVMKDIPESMVIVGAGAIGLEFAYFYNVLGTKVTIVEFQERIAPFEDEEVSKELARNFRKQGMKTMVGSSVEKVDAADKLCKVSVKTEETNEELECDIVLSAVGVTPNIEGIGLEELKVATQDGKVVVDEFYRTNVEGIYAIGDIIKGPALAHVASAEGILCVEHIAGKSPEPLDYNNIPSCTYCRPEVASVGYTEKGAIEAGFEVKVGKFPFMASGKASASGAREGFVKVIFDSKYGEWLGAHMVGQNVTEMIAEVVTARKLETTGHEIIKAVHPHPTMSEAIMEATAAAYGEVIHL